MPGRAGAMRNRRNPSGKPPAAVYVVFFLSLSLLLSLGGWQWHRGLEKAAIEKLIGPQKNSPKNQSAKNQYTTIDRAPPNWSALAYRQVRLEGGWRTGRVFLLANRTHRGRLGYEVFSPFQLAGDGATLLVNRGWVERADASADQHLDNAADNAADHAPDHAPDNRCAGACRRKGSTLSSEKRFHPGAGV